MLPNKKIILLVVGLLGLSALTMALQKHYLKNAAHAEETQQTVKFDKPVLDKVLLTKFEKLIKRYDTLKNNYTIRGAITIADGADSTARQKDVQFVLCKHGEDIYYKLGNTETINRNGIYLYIDHTARRILVTHQKQIHVNAPMQNMTQLADNIESEYYNLSGSVNANIQTISLINDHHITCKRYTISYDTLNYQVKHLYARLTNFSDPLNRAKDKTMDIQLNQWDAADDIAKYAPEHTIVQKREGRFVIISSEYKNYEIINL